MSDIWLNIGTIEPSLGEWKFFQNPSVNGSFIRVSFSGLTVQNIGGVFTRLLLRRYWVNAEPPMADKPIWIKPSLIATVINTPLNQSYQDAGLVLYDWQAMLTVKPRFSLIGREEPIYTVTLEEI